MLENVKKWARAEQPCGNTTGYREARKNKEK